MFHANALHKASASKAGLHFVKAFLESVRLKARCIRGNPIWLEQLSEP